jgi:integrase
VRHPKPYRLYRRPDTGYFSYKLPGGKWKTTGKTKEHEAHRYMIEEVLPYAVDGDEGVSRPQIPTLRQYAVEFFKWETCDWIRRQHAKGRPFSKGVAKLRRAQLENHLFPTFGDLPLDRFNAAEVENWLLGLELSNQTRNHLLDTLNIVLREAKREKLVATNPLTDVERMANTYRRRDTLTLQECVLLFPRDKAKLLEIWGQPKWAALFYTLLTSGIRVGEAAALQWRHVIWETPAILLVEQAVKSDGEIGVPKSGDVRGVILPRRTKYVLGWWCNQSPFKEQEHFVFFGEWGDKHLNRKTISRKFPPALKAAEIDIGDRFITAHSLRHTYNSRMRKVLPEALLQYMMGHSSRTMTDRYTNMLPAERLRQYLPAAPELNSTWN